MPKVTPMERVHQDGTREQGFVVLDHDHESMEAPFFAELADAVEHANEISTLRQMAGVAL